MEQNKPFFVHAAVEEPRDMEEVFSQSVLFELALQQVLQQELRLLETTSEAERNQFLTTLAKTCHDFGVKEENAVMYAQFKYWAHRREVELIVQNTYAGLRQPIGRRTKMSACQRKQLLIDDFLERNYALRYNVMKRETEYASLKRRHFHFSPLTERERYEMRTRMEREGIMLWDCDLKQRLTSREVRDFLPMEDFLCRLPAWDKKPRIKRLAETIPTNDKEWPDRFRRWFLSMVAHWLEHDTRYGNSLIPVLVGPQGCGKSQWIRSLLPVELADYYHDGFDMRRRNEAEAMMTRYALINIDEFDAIPVKQEPVLKHLIQLTDVHVDGQAARRFCSFIATSNHYDLHRDTSGSRRYIFVDITGDIHLNHRLSLTQIYAEAVYAIRQERERTYFTKQEEQAMQASNESFREQDISEQLFLHYYDPLPCRAKAEGDQWATAVEICQELERLSKKDFGLKRATRFGAILRKHCTQQGTKRGRTSMLYHVRKKPSAPATDSHAGHTAEEPGIVR